MRRVSMIGSALLLPALLLVASPGCGKKDGGGDGNTTATTNANKDKDKDKHGTPSVAYRPAKKGDTAVKATSLDGVIKGKVVYDGTPPPREAIPALLKHEEKRCHDASVPEDQKINQTWLVDPKSKGVANVVVFLVPPDKHYFPFDPEKDDVTKEVTVLKQPHCAFLPHANTVFLVYFDGKQHVKTGQVAKIINNAPFAHNSKYDGDPEDIGSNNLALKPGQEIVLPWKHASRKAVKFSCQLHPWMSATVWSVDHPYFAVTDENGNFEIKNVPTGVDLMLGAWHESRHPNELKAFESHKVNVGKGGTVEQDFKVSAPK